MKFEGKSDMKEMKENHQLQFRKPDNTTFEKRVNCKPSDCKDCKYGQLVVEFAGQRLKYHPENCKYTTLTPKVKKVFNPTDKCIPSKCRVCKYREYALVNTGGQRDKYEPLNCIHYFDNVETDIKILHEKFKPEHLFLCFMDNDKYKIYLTIHINDFDKITCVDKEKDKYNVLQMLSDKQNMKLKV